MKPKEYSIWLMPKGSVYENFKEIIISLAQKHNSVPFEPHVTLISAGVVFKEEMILKTQELAKTTKPFTIHLENIFYMDEFYRCLFVKAEKTRELVKLNTEARETFAKQDDREFMPHLSLLYGRYPAIEKEGMIQDIGEELDFSFEVSSLIINEFINIEDVNVVKKWKIIGEFPVGG